MIKNKKFLLLFSSTFFSSFGDAILFVVLLTALQGLETTAISTSYYLLFSALPVLLFGLQIGAFVERKTLQKVMISSDVIRFALIILFFSLSLFEINSGLPIYLLVFLITFVNIFFTNASATLIPKLINQEHLAKANSVLRVVNMTAKLFSYSAAALLFTMNVSVNQCLLFISILYFLSFISVAFIRPYYQNKEIVIAEESLLSAVLKGLIYIKSNKTIFKLLLIFSLGWMVGAAIDIYLISYLREVFGKGAESLYIITTPTLIGILIGSVISPVLYKKIEKKYGFLFSLIAFGFTILCFALELPLLILQLLLIVGGISQGILNIFLVSYLQSHVDSNYLARVFSVYNLIYIGGGIPGYLLFGLLIDYYGVISIGFVLSFYLLLIGIICIMYIPSLEQKTNESCQRL